MAFGLKFLINILVLKNIISTMTILVTVIMLTEMISNLK